MTSEFLVYLRLGLEHIADIRGYDHILFIVALCAGYQLRDWRTLLWLVTAFTVGHSVTLALATLRILTIDDALIEFLIPVTIFIMGFIDILEKENSRLEGARFYKYALALGFGLIHGMGFSNFLRTVLGAEESIALPLFAFNVGLEIGQILIVACVLTLTTVMVRFVKMQRRDWSLVLAGATAGVAVTMIVDFLVA